MIGMRLESNSGNVMRAARIAVVCISLALLSIVGRASDGDSWIADANGCKFWNPRPQPNESVTWSGQCRDGYGEGVGVLQWFSDGKSASRHEGTFVRGKAAGRGSVISADGIRYEGNFSDGQRSGEGVMTGPKGGRYEGHWVDNKREGKGSQVFADGSRYDGDWKDDKPTHPELITRKTYSIKEEVLGSHISSEGIHRIPVPVDKTYSELTPAEKMLVKSLYEPMADADEPPYPLHGPRRILETCEEIEKYLRVRGGLSLAVTVDPDGKPVAVEVLKSPDAEMTKKMAMVLMLEKYKPAVCNGAPCQMQYPFRMEFH
jgi:hypothetical protein